MERQCALCLKNLKLCRSHIIPEFLYESMYDEDHKFHVLSSRENTSNHMRQKGLWEWLLCAECESNFSKLERYASMVLKGGVPLTITKEGTIVTVSGVDYKAFKLFQLSILWRSSIAKSPFFGKVNLGKHQEILREILLKNKLEVSHKYGCIMFGLKPQEEQSAIGIMVQPILVKINGHICYHFIFGGFAWVYFVSSHNLPRLLQSTFLQENGQLIISLQDFYASAWMKEFVSKLKIMGRL